MADKPTSVPDWNTGGANNVDPGGAKKALGWEFEEEPSSSFFNWLQKLYGEWFTWLNDRVTNTGGTSPRIGLRGIGTTGESNGTGITATGHGTGSGVEGTGGATGYGIIAGADTTSPVRAAFRIIPQDANPSSPQEGDVYANSVSKTPKFYNGTVWRDILNQHVVTVGDGVTTFGDYNGTTGTPIQAAIDSLASGGTIFLRRGTYTLATGLSVTTDNLRIVGEGREVSIITTSVIGDSGCVFALGAGVNGFELHDVGMIQTAGPYDNYVLFLNDGENCVIDNCKLEHTFAGTNAETAPYSVIRFLNGKNCRISNNLINFRPSILTGGGVNRTGIRLEAISIAAVAGRCLRNFIVNNVFMVAPQGVAPTSYTSMVALRATTADGGDAVCNNNVITGNVLAGTVGTTTASIFYAFYIRAANTAAGVASIVRNVIQGNAFAGATSLDGGSSTDVNFYINADAAAVISGNAIVENVCANGGAAFTYAGAGAPAATANSSSLAGFWVAASSGGAVTSQITDTQLNQ